MSSLLQGRVWDALYRIPPGKVATYSGVARHLRSKAVRVVASAIGKNPNAPECPCHRVVRSDGSVGLYSGPGGVAGKIKLLTKEGVEIKNGKIDLSRFEYRM